MDEIITKFSDLLGKIYDDRTAGDYSFIGVLHAFLEDVTDECAAVNELVDKHNNTKHLSFDDKH